MAVELGTGCAGHPRERGERPLLAELGTAVGPAAWGCLGLRLRGLHTVTPGAAPKGGDGPRSGYTCSG